MLRADMTGVKYSSRPSPTTITLISADHISTFRPRTVPRPIFFVSDSAGGPPLGLAAGLFDSGSAGLGGASFLTLAACPAPRSLEIRLGAPSVPVARGDFGLRRGVGGLALRRSLGRASVGSVGSVIPTPSPDRRAHCGWP